MQQTKKLVMSFFVVQIGDAMKKGDVIIIIALLIFATIHSYIQMQTKQEGLKTMIIVRNAEIIHQYRFDEDFDKEIVVNENGERNVIQIHNGEIRMIEANCPDQLCMHSRSISKNGEMIVCLPHQLYVKVQSENNNEEIDLIAQ